MGLVALRTSLCVLTVPCTLATPLLSHLYRNMQVLFTAFSWATCPWQTSLMKVGCVWTFPGWDLHYCHE